MFIIFYGLSLACGIIPFIQYLYEICVKVNGFQDFVFECMYAFFHALYGFKFYMYSLYPQSIISHVGN